MKCYAVLCFAVLSTFGYAQKHPFKCECQELQDCMRNSDLNDPADKKPPPEKPASVEDCKSKCGPKLGSFGPGMAACQKMQPSPMKQFKQLLKQRSKFLKCFLNHENVCVIYSRRKRDVGGDAKAALLKAGFPEEYGDFVDCMKSCIGDSSNPVKEAMKKVEQLDSAVKKCAKQLGCTADSRGVAKAKKECMKESMEDYQKDPEATKACECARNALKMDEAQLPC